MNLESGFLLPGFVFGLSAGLSPGPLLTLVVAETLKHNATEGVKIAISPLLTDFPIILLTVFILSGLAHVDPVIGIIALCGGGYIAWLGWGSLTFDGADIQPQDAPPRSIRKGVIANFLNPSPYLFWFSVGGPLMLRALSDSLLSAVSFVLPFYLLLVGMKVLVAIAVGRSRSFLKSTFYVWTIRILGGLLFVFAILFFRNGLSRLGLLTG